MKILSLFDGMSVAQQALKDAGIPVEFYFACEIDEYAMAVTQANHPDTNQFGDVRSFNDGKGVFKKESELIGPIDLLIGGSPCQDLSIAKKGREGLSGSRSGLFWEYVRIRDEVKPKYFILENVASMPKEAKDTISEALGVQPVMINASLVSAQNRKRYFWCGQIRERLYHNDVLCYNCLCNENTGIQTKTQKEGEAEILGQTQERHINMQGVSERISENKSQRDNQDLLSKMYGNQQKEQRQKQGQTEEGRLSENVSKEERKETKRIPEELSSIPNMETKNGRRRQATSQVDDKENTSLLSKTTNRNKEEVNQRRGNGDFGNETEMCCVRCHKRLDHRPFNTFIQRGNERFEQFTSDVSELQFKKTQQNNGRIYDIYKVEIPQPEDRGILLKDILESDVDEKYFLDKDFALTPSTNNDIAGTLDTGTWKKRYEQIRRVYKSSAKSPTIPTGTGGGVITKVAVPVALRNRGEGKKPEYNGTDKANAMTSVQTDSMVAIQIPEATKKGYALAKEGQSVDLSFPDSKTRRGRVGDKVKNLMTSQNIGVVQNMQIRKLTPTECLRLQSMPDDYFDKVLYKGKPISNTQRYKMCGNAFNKEVIVHILRHLS